MEFYLAKYKGQWAIYSITAKCPVCFGPKRRLEKRLIELNEYHKTL